MEIEIGQVSREQASPSLISFIQNGKYIYYYTKERSDKNKQCDMFKLMKYDLKNKEERYIGAEHGDGLIPIERSNGYEAVSILICKSDRYFGKRFYHDKLNDEVTFLQQLYLLVVSIN